MYEIPKLDESGLKKFSYTFSISIIVFFGLLLPWIFGFRYSLWPWFCAAIISLWGTLAPLSIRPVYKYWMKFGVVLNKIVTPVIMGLIYCLLFIPMGVILRMTGKLTLNEAYDEHTDSFRVKLEQEKRTNLDNPF